MTEPQQLSLPELEAARAELDAQIATAKLEAKSDAIARVKALMAELGVTQRMLGGPGTPVKAAKAKHPSAGTKVAVKYRCYINGPDGSPTVLEWSGRGMQPKWLREAIAAGASLESFAV